MDDIVKRLARDVAKTVEASSHSGARLGVEEQIATEGASQLSDPLAVGALIVASVSLAWRVAWDLYLEHKRKDAELKGDEVRIMVSKAIADQLSSASIDSALRAQLVEATATAVVARLAHSQ